MKRNRLKTGIFLVCVTVIIVYVVSIRMPKQHAERNTISVAASFYPIGYFAERVGGEYVEVTIATPPGVEPHDFEPSAQQVAGFYNTRVFLYNGNGIDVWAERLAPQLKEKGVITAELMGAVQITDAALRGDPHAWLDPVDGGIAYVQDIESALSEADPLHADAYHTNAQAVIADLNALDVSISSALRTCKSRDVIVSHEAFAYFGRRYGLTIVPITGLSPESEPAPKKLAEIASFARTHSISTVFFETLVSPKIAQTLAREIGVVTDMLNPIEGLTDDNVHAGETYFSIMQKNLKALVAALRC